jgi:nicotinate-nucleotide--dimethylbenzimidazole phosphoribosyltransferase
LRVRHGVIDGVIRHWAIIPPMQDTRRPPSPDTSAQSAARERQQQLTKPPGALGRLEDLACWLAGRLGSPAPEMPRAEIFVFAADHGVAARGVSAFPQSVTASMLDNFAHGGAAINVLATMQNCRIEVVDVGVASDSPPPPGIRNERIRPGTRDLTEEAALSAAEASAALEVGARCAREACNRGARLLIAGEMGIANTTAAACLICALTGASPERIVGRGTGIDDTGLARKRAVVKSALARLGGERQALRLLTELGGLEIAAMSGFYLEAARTGVPVLLDGYISSAAALVAASIESAARPWMLASHASAEAGHAIALEALGLTPLLSLNLRLGEGTGAALTLSIIRAALDLHRKMATFSEAGIAGKV